MDAGARTLRAAATVQGGLHRQPKLATLPPRLCSSWLLASKQSVFFDHTCDLGSCSNQPSKSPCPQSSEGCVMLDLQGLAALHDLKADLQDPVMTYV